MTIQMPPIRPGWVTRLANRLGVTRQELVAALWTTAAGAPVAATVVILATVPVPQPMNAVPFDPASPVIATAVPPAPPSPEPSAARTRAQAPPRVHVAPEPTQASRTRTEPATAAFSSCAQARAGGRSDIPRSDPAYRPGLDRDDDGIACESTGEAGGESEVDDPTSSAAEPTMKPPAPTDERSTSPTTDPGVRIDADLP